MCGKQGRKRGSECRWKEENIMAWQHTRSKERKRSRSVCRTDRWMMSKPLVYLRRRTHGFLWKWELPDTGVRREGSCPFYLHVGQFHVYSLWWRSNYCRPDMVIMWCASGTPTTGYNSPFGFLTFYIWTVAFICYVIGVVSSAFHSNIPYLLTTISAL